MSLRNFKYRLIFCFLSLYSAVVNASDSGRLKADALHLLSDIKLADMALTKADPSIVIYIANRDESLVIQSVSVSLDGKEALRYSYSELEAEALYEGALHRLVELNLPSEGHTLSVKFAVIDGAAGAHAERSFPRIEKTISLTENTQWQFDLVRDGWFDWQKKAAIQVRDHGQEASLANRDNQLRLKSIYFNAKRHFAFDALTDAMTLLKSGVGAEQFSAPLKQLLSRSVVELALPEVPTLLQGVIAPSQGNPVSAASAAINQYNAGVALLQRGSVSEGVALLTELSAGESLADDVVLLRDKINLALGFHFLQQGDSEQSVKYFSQVRRLSPFANKALVGLGWALLSPRQNQVAPLPANDSKAPGVGAKTMPYLWSGSEDDIAWARRHTPFRRAWAIASGGKEEDLQAAMVPWMELINRDPLDPAVQEGLLILPYALSHWSGQAQRAEAYYRSAASRLQDALLSLAGASSDVQQGGLRAAIDLADARGSSGWDIWLSALYEDKEAYLDLLLESSNFHRALSDYRQLTRIHDQLSSYQTSAIAKANEGQLGDKLAVLRSRLTESVASAAEALDREALAQIARHRQRTEAYLAEANFALARNHENTRRKLSGVVWDGEAIR